MVEYELIHEDGDDFDCEVHIEGEHPETADIELSNCDFTINDINPLVGGFERGQVVNLRMFGGENASDRDMRQNKVKSRGGDSYGSVSVRFNKMDNDVEVIHFLVDDTMRGKRIGKTLFTIVMGMAEIEGGGNVRMNIGGGEKTAGWLSKMGVPRSDIEVRNGSLATVNTTLDRIDYDDSNLTVEKTDG